MGIYDLVKTRLFNYNFSIYSEESKKPKFVIDNDAGGDDAMAIFLALLYEKQFDGYVKLNSY